MASKIIHNEEHYSEVIQRIKNAKRTLWIGTADIKDLHVESVRGAVSFLSVLDQLCRRGVAIRLVYAKAPGPNFQSSFDKYPLLKKGMEIVLCPRVHFKMIIIDFAWAYFGSANLTGAGLGLKSPNNRNFETGMISTEEALIDHLTDQFDSLWMGKHCPSCGRKKYCENPLK